VLKTESKQSDATSWDTTVLYCATSYEEARIAFLKSEVHDYSRGLGNSARQTKIEKFASFPTEIDSIEPEELEDR
jgi:hypothetical protein